MRILWGPYERASRLSVKSHQEEMKVLTSFESPAITSRARAFITCRLIDVGPFLHQGTDHLQESSLAGDEERRLLGVQAPVDVCPQAEQPLHLGLQVLGDLGGRGGSGFGCLGLGVSGWGGGLQGSRRHGGTKTAASDLGPATPRHASKRPLSQKRVATSPWPFWQAM